jgi:hypothetical protein
MKKKDFTGDAIREEIEDYLLNQNFPDDELLEIGGSHVSLDGVHNVEIDSVKKSGDNFIVSGSASLDVCTDLGEGDGFDDSYPMTFSFEFDDSGKIVAQLRRHIDTSSFFAGNEDLYGDLVGLECSSHLGVFQDSLFDIRRLLNQPAAVPPKFLYKLLYVHVVTALETYLSDFLVSRVLNDDATLRVFIEKAPVFQEQKISISEVFKTRETIKTRATQFFERVVWHRVDKVGELYKRVLNIEFPNDLSRVEDVVKLRNLLVHRNGKGIDNSVREVSEQDIIDAIGVAEQLVTHIEDRWRELQQGPQPQPVF